MNNPKPHQQTEPPQVDPGLVRIARFVFGVLILGGALFCASVLARSIGLIP